MAEVNEDLYDQLKWEQLGASQSSASHQLNLSPIEWRIVASAVSNHVQDLRDAAKKSGNKSLRALVEDHLYLMDSVADRLEAFVAVIDVATGGR